MKKQSSLDIYDVGEDPSENEGFVEVMQKEILVKIDRGESDKKFKQFEDWIMLRVFSSKSNEIKLQLTSEVDVFFFYILNADWEILEDELKAKQINISFSQFPHWWRNILQNKKQEYIIGFSIISQQQGILNIYQKLSYKMVNILTLTFQKAPNDIFKQNIMYRYRRMQAKKHMLQEVLFKGNQLIKLKNPSLLLGFQKTRKQNIFK